MKSEAGRFSLPSRLAFPFKWSGLRARMTISYMSVTLGSVLSFLILTMLVSGALSVIFSDTGDRTFTAAIQQAQSYALVAAVQAQGVALDPQTNFIPGHAYTLALPGQENQDYRVFAPYIATASSDPTSVSLERRSRNGKDEVDRTSWGWLAQET